jgi:hypothetical protein
MSGYKVFQNGDILDANTDVNPFLMRQAVMVFDDAADRTAQLDGDELEGMVTYRKDVGHLERYDGSAWVAAAGLAAVVKFDTTGTTNFSKADYPWLRAVRVRVQGGGGGGGGCGGTGASTRSAAVPGGGGGYAESFITDLSTIADPIVVTVGAGGAAGAAGPNNGTSGGTSSFGTLLVAGGGTNGLGVGPISTLTTLSPRSGGTATAGQILIPGGSSGSGIINEPGGFSHSGPAGESVLGTAAGGRWIHGTGSSAGGDSGGFGAGGGSPALGNSVVDQPGRAGGPGIVILELYA